MRPWPDLDTSGQGFEELLGIRIFWLIVEIAPYIPVGLIHRWQEFENHDVERIGPVCGARLGDNIRVLSVNLI